MKNSIWWIHNPDYHIFGMPFLEANNFVLSEVNHNYYEIIEQLWAIREGLA